MAQEMTKEEKIKKLSTWIHGSIDDFYNFASGKTSLKTLCNIIACEVIKFEKQFKGV